MDSWAVVVGLGLLAAAIGVVAFVRYRQRETATLQHDVALARDLRDLAGTDEVRRASVDEFELAIYQRLFYVSVVGPRIRSAAWAVLGAALSMTAALAASAGDGVLYTVAQIGALVVAAVFTLATVTFAVMALVHAATTPRVSFVESYATEGASTDS
ncbi:hypothetical protein GIY30_20745 [Gordonia sp. HNM0687]|uniref:DUF2721 domain-containing protein n=1 Tax=Gordonia mangrovi TaxID=2665643 RepID=A0A6L7GV60_9ACTN|nr:hypothetical protein [Gordonia mangrovi]MXP23770.1 hypothetical protein [Gordonia mangrovi]UVF79824.1 hypothetical protein NWF22_08365 [Gordonia mangrovi]